MMAQLYDVEVPTINDHLKKVFEDSELEEAAVIRKFRITAAEVVVDRADASKKHMGLHSWTAVLRFPFVARTGMFMDMASSKIQCPKVRVVDHASVGAMDFSMVSRAGGFR